MATPLSAYESRRQALQDLIDAVDKVLEDWYYEEVCISPLMSVSIPHEKLIALFQAMQKIKGFQPSDPH